MNPPDQAELLRTLADCNILEDESSVAAANTATFHTTSTCRFIVQPRSREALVEAVKLIGRHRLRFHVVSRGHNWGFGSKVPVRDVELLLDLSAMNRILSYDPEFGTVRVEPGVTFAQLAEHLAAQGGRHFLNTIGGSPHASVLGNVLERGDGVGPYCERSEHACSPEVVLVDGTVVDLGFGNIRGSRVAELCKSGLGPGLQELFMQSNLGIVTAMTIWLCRRPTHFRSVYFGVERHRQLGPLLDALRELYGRRVLSAPLTFWNDYKQVATSIQYPWEVQGGQTPLPRSTLVASSNDYGAWIGFGGIYVDHQPIAELVEEELFLAIGPYIREPSLRSRLNDESVAALRTLDAALQDTPLQDTPSRFDELLHTWANNPLLGHPTSASVRSLFWRKRRPPPEAIEPERQRCGVLWNSFTLPFRGEEVAKALADLDALILAGGFEPITSFVLINDRYVRVFQQLVYDRETPGEDQRAMACHAQVFAFVENAGYSHNRLDIHSMARAGNIMLSDTLHQRIKDALDPDGLLSPGRYFMRSSPRTR